MEDKTISLEDLIESVEEYAKKGYTLVTLKALDKVTDVASTLIVHIIVVIVLFMFIVLLNIGAALWIGDLLGKSYYGFFCVAGFYGFIGGVLYFFRRVGLKKSIRDSLISLMLD